MKEWEKLGISEENYNYWYVEKVKLDENIVKYVKPEIDKDGNKVYKIKNIWK